jgi:hypothetical protein
MYFDGSGDWLLMPAGDKFAFGTGDYTVEAWVYFTSITTSDLQIIFMSGSTGGNTFFFHADGNQLSVGTDSAFISNQATTFNTNTWYHVAACRTASTLKLFVNGNQIGSSVSDTTNWISSGTARIGSNTSGAQTFNGYIADHRITKGYARYLYNFTAPTAAFPLFWQAAATPSSDPYFDYTTLLLPGNGTNGAQNNTFLDSSTNAFTITRNGNTTQGTFTPFSQTGWGNFFDGTGDYLSVANNVAFQFGTGDLTCEAWVYPTATPATNYTQIVGMQEYGASLSWLLGIDTNLNLRGSLQTTSPVSSTELTGGQIPLHQWSHVAMSRSSNVFSIYINGVRVATTTTSQNVDSSGNNLTIGADNNGDEGVFTGYISNVRVVKGSAVYTGASFTVPTSALTAVANTSLLTCQSNRFVDNSTNAFTITKNGDTSVQAFSPFNPTAAYSTSTVGGSGYFDGSGDYLLAASNSAFALGTGDFTVETFAYYNSLSQADAALIINWDGITWAANKWSLHANHVSYPSKVSFFVNNINSSTAVLVSTTTMTLGQWYHIAVSRSGNTFRLFINGALEATATSSASMDGGNNSPIYVGGGLSAGNTQWFNGYLSSPRLVKGTAVYTAAFTPPTAPLTAITNTSLLLSGTNGGIIDNTAKNNLETVGGASISTTVSKFGGSSMYFDGTGDYLQAPNTMNANFGSGDFTVEFWMYASSQALAPIIHQTSYASNLGWIVWNYDGVNGATSTRKLTFMANGTGSTITTSSDAYSDNTWTHIAVVKYGTGTNNIRIYSNGIKIGEGTYSTALSNATQPFIVGGIINGVSWNSTAYYNGYLQDIRVTKGIGRYTSNFTPPTTAFLTL